MSFLTELSYWYWFSFGIMLLVLELFGAGGFLLWVGLAAILTGVIILLFPQLAWNIQLIVFALLAIGHTMFWWQYVKHRPKQTKLNQRNLSYVGKISELQEPIQNGRGKIHLGDTVWIASAEEDIPAHKKVRVIGVNGTILKVEAID